MAVPLGKPKADQVAEVLLEETRAGVEQLDVLILEDLDRFNGCELVTGEPGCPKSI